MSAITLDIAQQQAVLKAIADAEDRTSGEVRVHIENTLKGNVLDRAANVFTELGMKATAERNGILFYIAITDKQFAVLGDKGIHEKVPTGFWDDIRNEVQNNFKAGDFVNGLVAGITLAGTELAKHFPRRDDDVNELPNDISINDN
jgi:uncharacterized membrane protein